MLKESVTRVGLDIETIREFRHLILQAREISLGNRQHKPLEKQIILQLDYLKTNIDDLIRSSDIRQYKTGHNRTSTGNKVRDEQRRSLEMGNSQYSEINYNDMQHSTPIKAKRRIFDKETPLNHLANEQTQNETNQLSNSQQLQKQNKKLLNKLIEIELKYQEISKQKDYCIELLNKSSVKDSDIEIELKCLRNQNKDLLNSIKQLKEQNRKLIEEDEQKSILLKDINEFMSIGQGNYNKKGMKSSRGTYSYENEKLISEIIQYQGEITRLNKQIRVLNEVNNNHQNQINNLINSHQEIMSTTNLLQIQNNQLKLKNQELINIQQSKRMNEIVHKQNKHLLQVNYELGNKIHGYQKEIEKLIIKIVELEGENNYNIISRGKCNNNKRGVETPTQEGISASPSANQGVCLEEYPSLSKTKSMNDLKTSSAQNTIYNLNLKLKNQTEINSQLQTKIEELLDQLYVCEKSIFEKEKEIANMSLSFNRAQQPVLNIAIVESENKKDESRVINNDMSLENKPGGTNIHIQDLSTEKDQILNLEEFVLKFQPSLMDTLFIMLRITQIAVIMIHQGYAKTIIPTQLLLQLDDPNKPQNIIVQLKESQNDEDLQTTKLFVSKQILQGEQFNEAAVVWNIGMIFYYLVAKESYFKNVQDFINIEQIELKENLLSQVEDLISGTLRIDSQRRITLDELLEGISEEINKIFSQY